MANPHELPQPDPREFRCPQCNTLLLKGVLRDAQVQIACPKCSTSALVLLITIEVRAKKKPGE